MNPMTVFKLKPAPHKAGDPYNIYQAAARQRRRMLAGEELAVKRILGAWKTAEARMAQRIQEMVQKIADAQAAGTKISPNWAFQQARYEALQKAIQTEISKFSALAQAVTTGQQAAQVQAAVRDVADLLEAGGAGVAGSFVKLPKGAFSDMVGYLTDKSPLHDLFSQIAPDAVAAARKVFAEEIAAGQHPYVIAKRLKAELGISKKRAVLIARTESIRCYRDAAIRNMAANSDVVSGWRYLAARDGRTCPVCLARDGVVHELDEPFGQPHPGCRCTPSPVVRYLDKPRDTGEEWLEKQPEDFQRATLGKTRFELWKDGKVKLPQMVQAVEHPRWGTGYRLTPLKDLLPQIAGGSLPPMPSSAVDPMLPKLGPKVQIPTAATAPAPTPPVVPAVPAPAAVPPPPPPAQIPIPAPSPAGYPYSINPKTGKAFKSANELADHLVGLGQLPPDEILLEVKAAFPKTVFQESHILAKAKKQGIALPASKAVPVPPPPMPAAAPVPIPPPNIPTLNPSTMKPWKSGAELAEHLAWNGSFDAKTIMAAVKAQFPKSSLTEKQILAKLAKYPKAPPPPSAVPPVKIAPVTPPIPAAPAPTPPPPPKPKAAPKAKVLDEQTILHQQTGGPAGSNAGGFYTGSDGVQRYVKFYSDPAQAHSEHLANQIYRALGLEAPESVVFTTSRGQTAYASTILPSQGTIGKLGMTAADADAILDGVLADILTANWDAVGTGLDNVVRLASGKVARIDSGGTFLFRAKAGRKPANVLHLITEWEGFANAGTNPYYAQVFSKAGISGVDGLGAARLKVQLAAIKKARGKGGWAAFVRKHTAGLAQAEQDQIVALLEARTTLLEARVKAVGKPPKPVKLPKPGKPVDPSKVKPKTLSATEGHQKRQQLYGNVWPQLTADQKNAILSYKGSAYRPMNQQMRFPGSHPSAASAIKSVEEAFQTFQQSPIDEDVMLYRGLGLKDWHNLDAKDIGRILTDEAFISTSDQEYFSTAWAKHKVNPVLLKMRVARGTVAIPPHAPTYGDGEFEWIFDGIQIRVTNVGKMNGITVIECDLVATREGRGSWIRKIK